MYVNYNMNPENKNVGDCTVRAISQVLNQTWEQTYVGIMLEGVYALRHALSQSYLGYIPQT